MTDELSRPPFPSEPKMGLAPVAVVEHSPTGLALVGQTLTRWAVGIGAFATLVAVTCGTLATAVPVTAPWAVPAAAIAGAVVLVCNQVTGASPGLRKEAGPQPVMEPPPPRIGPVP